ncbi:hypothetical protein BsWGS_22372 [Bradybaena similaris]
MADQEACSRIEQRSVIKFLVAEECKPVEIHRRMSTVDGAKCFSRKNVYKWAQLFKGRSSVEDEDRPGRPTEVRSPEVIESVNDLIQSDRRVTVDDIARTLSLSVGTDAGVISQKESSCIMTTQGLAQQPERCRPSMSWAGSCSLIPLTAQTLLLHPSDFDLFGPLKAFTRGTKFESDDEVKSVVSDWLRHQSKDFYAEGIWKLVHRWEKCVTVLGDYVEK